MSTCPIDERSKNQMRLLQKKTVDNQKGTQGLLPKAFKQNNNTMYIHT